MHPHVQLQPQLKFTGTDGEVTKGWWLFHSNEKNNQPFVIRANVVPFPFLHDCCCLPLSLIDCAVVFLFIVVVFFLSSDTRIE